MKSTSRYQIITAALAVAAVLGVLSLRAADAKHKHSTHDVMEKYHKAPKGVDSISKKIANGQGSKEDIAGILEGYKAMTVEKPEQGDVANWKKLTTALVASMTAVQKGEAGALEKYKTAVNCKACHDEFKPKH